MTDYETMSKLQFFDVKNHPKMHWSRSTSWEMTTYMHEAVVKKFEIWCKMPNSFPFLVMRSQLVTNNCGFPYMHMWLKVGK
jgi:hypothetical protein